jgi:D-alanyl-lipoteichoic acid acyltransferase DltB (MBOAT superfamily)
MWRFDFAFLMVFSSIVDFTASKKIAETENTKHRKLYLILALAVNLGLLVFFKYTYFILDNIQYFSGHQIDLGFSILLPIGISFYTFQTISYTIDVYRKIITPQDRFIPFLAYVTFWPQLVAGPILRANEILPQLKANLKLKIQDLNLGIYLIIIGLFKKVVLADNIAPVADEIFSLNPEYLNAFDVWVGAFLFGFQIYFDFSGYSDIAIGSARLLGIRFPDNFNWPYMSKSPREFWSRWHITLSSWIRDYLYIPLTGQKYKSKSTGGLENVFTHPSSTNKTFALFATWFIMGLWHGAGWNFVLWGIYHAFFIFLYRSITVLKGIENKVPIVAWAITLLISMAGWIPFRAATLDQSLIMFFSLINPLEYNIFDKELSFFYYLYAGLLTVAMLLLFSFRKVVLFKKEKLQPLPHAIIVSTMVLLIIVFMQTKVQFIYFQF